MVHVGISVLGSLFSLAVNDRLDEVLRTVSLAESGTMGLEMSITTASKRAGKRNKVT